MSKGVLAKYSKMLPITEATPEISLGEGDTPLVSSRKLKYQLNCAELYFKLEGCNPTGSFKDRGMVVAVAKALEHNSRALICASTGNTSAAAAAYGAHCGIPTFVLVPKGDVAKGKLAQAIAHGAKILSVKGNFDQALSLVRHVTDKYPITLVNSVNPHRLEGQKTAAFEIIDDLGIAPDFLFIPVGNAGNITAYWKGFMEYHSSGISNDLPRMMGFQAAGAAPIVDGNIVEKPETVASAIRIGNPANWEGALLARDESGGVIDIVTDSEILAAYSRLATDEGIFCEPASAASLAGLIKIRESGVDLSKSKVVCVLTGTGLKDPELVNLSSSSEVIEVSTNLEDVEANLLIPTG